ncbi:PP2C family protein-serine/threonine phosphatase [Amycolatopsis thermalba]|uniref:PP2C family protein-serine/threonine phosphatase n=1 Tax=Amycolatopsis thermalba TaxID=944492 RepID=UPI000E237609|nr:PP2C family protein-serine/threonine phosphatase [Amycolatopsis thermalba]
MTTPVSIDQELRSAAPHELLDVVRAHLAEHFQAIGADLLMADYGLTMLQPVATLPYTTRPLPVAGSVAGEAFTSQQAVARPAHGGAVTLFLPVSVRGDRLGVLSVDLPAAPADAAVAGLLHLADALGHEIIIAERDTDLYLQARRARRLTLAAEMQWQLLPGRSCARPEFRIGAQLQPAYAIRGDNFDWSTSADHLILTVSNGMGEGIDASLLTNLAVNALRNARRAGGPLADQAMLADQAVYAKYRGRAHVATLLLRFDLTTSEVEAIDAGSPRLWRLRGGEAEPMVFEQQLPLGMFEDTPYRSEHFRVEAGDRLILVSDGVYGAAPAREQAQLAALSEVMHTTRELPAAHVPSAILDHMSGFRDHTAATDDSTVVCLDWHGR